MKDGRTHLAHKLEHAVDMDTGAILATTVQPISGDTQSLSQTLSEAEQGLQRVGLGGVAGGGVRQGVPRERDDETAGRGWRSQLRERAAAATTALGQRSRSAATDLCEPAPEQRRARQAFAASTRRSAGAIVRAPVGDGRDAPGASSRA